MKTISEAAGSLIEEGCLINLTPHPVRVPMYMYCWIGDAQKAYDDPKCPIEKVQTNAQIMAGVGGGPSEWVEIPSSGSFRLEELESPGNANDLCLGAVLFDFMPESPMGICAGIVTRAFDIGELPEAKEGVTYIVSLPALMGLVAAGIERNDLVAPDTGGTADRGPRGEILGVRGFVRLRV